MPGGRPRTPTRVLQLRGTHRKDRHGDPAAEVQFEKLTELPPPPGFLDPVGVMEWERIGPELVEKQLLTTVDMAAFTAYCLNVARMVAAEKAINEKGLIVLTPFGQLQTNPAVSIARQAGVEVRKFCQEFGLTPSARTRVRTPEKPAPKKDDPWSEVG
jgi:P27 family predicted phage terminase small subunit